MEDHAHEPDPDARVTAPMQAFTGREAAIGAVVTVVGVLLAYVLPVLATT